MLNKILYWIYLCFPDRFQDFMVSEYVKEIPDDVTGKAFNVISIQKHRLKRLTDYLAYNLHRKMASDPKNSVQYQGMFIQLKILDSMIIGRPEVGESKQDVLKTEEASTYDEDLKAIDKFAEDLIERRKK